MKFVDYLKEQQNITLAQRTQLAEQNNTKAQIATLLYLSENSLMSTNLLTEDEFNEGIKDWFAKMGIEVTKGTGIIEHLKNFTVGAGKMVWAAVRGDVEGIKKVAENFDAADLIDFLLRLDDVTLGLVTNVGTIIYSRPRFTLDGFNI